MNQLNSKDHYNKFLFSISAVIVLIDQISKLYIKGFDFFGIQHNGMFLGESNPFWGDLVRITFVENPGMAFGIEFGAGKIFLSLFSVFASIVLVVIIHRLKEYHLAIRIAFTLILAGAVGNLIDRVFYGVIFGESALFYGKVVDFIQVDIPDINFAGIHYTHWPVFNVADSCVSIGVVLLIIFNSKIPDLVAIIKNKHTSSVPPASDEEETKTETTDNTEENV